MKCQEVNRQESLEHRKAVAVLQIELDKLHGPLMQEIYGIYDTLRLERQVHLELLHSLCVVHLCHICCVSVSHLLCICAPPTA